MTAHDTIAAILSDLRERSGLSLEQVAKAAGYSGRSSVQRYFEDHDINSMRPSVAAKFAKVFYGKGSPPIGIEDLQKLILTRPYSDINDQYTIVSMLDLVDEVYGQIPRKNAGKKHDYTVDDVIPVMGGMRSDHWFNKEENRKINKKFLAFPFKPQHIKKGTYAIQVWDDTVSNFAVIGSFAICEAPEFFQDFYDPGTCVHVEREKEGMVEWTIRTVRYDGPTMLLCSEHRFPAAQNALRYDPNDQSVHIVGRVLGWYRPA